MKRPVRRRPQAARPRRSSTGPMLLVQMNSADREIVRYAFLSAFFVVSTLAQRRRWFGVTTKERFFAKLEADAEACARNPRRRSWLRGAIRRVKHDLDNPPVRPRR